LALNGWGQSAPSTAVLVLTHNTPCPRAVSTFLIQHVVPVLTFLIVARDSIAPRVHGELLKLGVTVSERTVSRYLSHRLTTPSQTWRTFLANHIGSLAFASTVMWSFATSDDDVYASVLPCRPVPRQATGGTLPLSGHWSIVLLRANRRFLAGVSHRINFTAAHVYVSALARTRRSWSLNLCWRRTTGGSLRPETPSRPKELFSSLRRNS